MGFIESVRTRAAAHRRHIAFPETGDARTLVAAEALAREGIVDPVLILDHEASNGADVLQLGIPALDPETDPRRAAIAERLLDRRASRGMTAEEAHRLAGTPLYFADGLVALGEADGCVAGAVHTTADVLRAALFLVGAAVGVRTVSSAFYMVVPPFREEGVEEVLTFTDCAVVPEPTSEQLSDIALAAARDRRRIVGDTPRVAMLSYSTLGSGFGPSVERVRAAARLLSERDPALSVDGELQGDAALMPDVGRRKAPSSQVAGVANVLVFPSLDAGNLAYKLVERLAGARAVGPIVQGLARPCSDLSRGASSDDIMNVAAITALQAADS